MKLSLHSAFYQIQILVKFTNTNNSNIFKGNELDERLLTFTFLQKLQYIYKFIIHK